MNVLKTFVATLYPKQPEVNTSVSNLYDVNISSLNGSLLDLKQFKGKYILFVNVASKCGFTPQYKELQELQDTYSDVLAVIGVPCNQFGRQEPGDADEIQEFCEINYGVTFNITEKVNVKGTHKHELYQFLTEKRNNGVRQSSVKWNFQKYLVDPQGKLVDYFLSTTKPLSPRITNYLK